jgi:hypothetical protein
MLIRRLTLTLAMIACCSTAIAQGVTPFCDMLYWRPSEEASAVWSNVHSTSPSGSALSAETVQFDWSPGFRIGFGHQSDPEAWDAKLYWTYLRTSQDAAVSGDIVVPEFFSGAISGDGRSFNTASIDWSLTYNTIDFEAGRKFAVGPSAWIRPSLGIKTAIIGQRMQLALANPGLRITAQEAVTHDSWGIGPSFGINGAWLLPRCNHLSLTGSFAADFLFGQWNVNDAYTRTDNQTPALVYGAVATSMKDSCLGVPVLRYFLGLEWVRQRQRCVTITARAGYELQWWANQLRSPAFQQLPMHGDLTLEGLTCGVSVGF